MSAQVLNYRSWKNTRSALFLTGLGLSIAGAVAELVAWGFYNDTPAVREATNQTAAIHNPDVDSEVDSTNWSTVVLIAAIASIVGAIAVTLINQLNVAEIQGVRTRCKGADSEFEREQIYKSSAGVRNWYWFLVAAASALTVLQVAVLVYASIGVDVGVANAAAFFRWTVAGAVITIAGHIIFFAAALYTSLNVVAICKQKLLGIDLDNPFARRRPVKEEEQPLLPPVGQSIGEAPMGYARMTQVVDPNAPLRNRQFTTA